MSFNRVNVYCYRESGRMNYTLQWTDRRGRKRRKSAGTPVEREAQRAAERLSKQLTDEPDIDRTKWEDFRKRFTAEVVKRTRTRTQRKFDAVLDDIEAVLSPVTVNDLDTAAIDKLTTHYYGKNLAAATIAGYLRYVRRALLWARDRSMLVDVPRITWPTGAGASGGRPLTTEEFERLLLACRKDRGHVAASWEHLLRGLWLSGLRISEAMALTWGDKGLLTMDLDGRRPMFSIRAELSKNGKAQRFPMPPEFFAMIDAVPSIDRAGFVFNPERKRITGTARGRLTAQQVGETIGKLGRDAAVKVKDAENGSPVYASAHDLRRSFGFRWAKRVMPPILQKMMRHSDIQTSLQFYVTQNEQQTADAVWEAVSMRDLPAILPAPAGKPQESR